MFSFLYIGMVFHALRTVGLNFARVRDPQQILKSRKKAGSLFWFVETIEKNQNKREKWESWILL